MKKLIKELRDEVCALSKDYLYTMSRNNYEIVIESNKVKCKKAATLKPEQIYFADKSECKTVAKLIEKIIEAKHKESPKRLSVRIEFKESITTGPLDKIYYDLKIDGKKVIEDGGIFSRIQYETYSEKHIVTKILLDLLDKYNIASKFNGFKNPKDISMFVGNYRCDNVNELLDATNTFKKIAKHLSKLKINLDELKSYVELIDEFDNDYNDDMLNCQQIKKLGEHYFDVSYTANLSELISNQGEPDE